MSTKGKVVFCTPSLCGPTAPYIKSLEDSLPLIVDAGWEEAYIQEISNPYISAARAMMTRKALDAKADVIVYIDFDLSWKPEDLLKLIETEGDVVSGTYRFKKDDEEYMGRWLCNDEGFPLVRPADGALEATLVPAGFLKVTRNALQTLAFKHPELCYGDPLSPSIDLFNHGAANYAWWGEDYAFANRWRKLGGQIWLVPDLDLNHWNIGYDQRTGKKYEAEYKGNLHEYLLRQDGGIKFQEERTDGYQY